MTKKTIVATLIASFVLLGLVFTLFSYSIAQQAKQTGLYNSEAEARQKLASNAADTTALRTLANRAAVKGDVAAAVRYLESAVRIDPSNRSDQFLLGARYYNAKRFDKALAIMDRLSQGDDDIAGSARRYALKVRAKIRE